VRWRAESACVRVNAVLAWWVGCRGCAIYDVRCASWIRFDSRRSVSRGLRGAAVMMVACDSREV
jgi:hypothetical protein